MMKPIFIGKEIAQHKDYSDQTAFLIDNEVRRILNESLESGEENIK